MSKPKPARYSFVHRSRWALMASSITSGSRSCLSRFDSIDATKSRNSSSVGPSAIVRSVGGDLGLQRVELTLSAFDHRAQICRQVGVEGVRRRLERGLRLSAGGQENDQHAPCLYECR